MDKNPRRRDEEAGPQGAQRASIPQITSSRPLASIKRQNTKEDSRDMQAKKKRNIQIKYSSPPHSMQYTN